jgi:hypothetical protein
VPHTASTCPLSSPTSDDQISNQSFESKRTATSSDLVSSPHSSQNPFDDTESGNTSGHDEFHLERYSESSTWTKNKSRKPHSDETSRDLLRGRDASLERGKKPGLNVITDFSKTTKQAQVENPPIKHVPVQRPILGKENKIPAIPSQTKIKGAALEGRYANPGFVNLSDLEGLRRNKKSKNPLRARKGARRSKPNMTQIKRADEEEKTAKNGNGERVSDRPLQEFSQNKSFKPLDGDREKGVHYLRAPEQEMNGVSPTARSVVIGISVPENEVEAHKPSDELSSALTLQTPMTPTIIVTPADATIGWAQSALQRSLMTRAASSMYSQATGTFYQPDADAPPVPSLPKPHKQFPVSEPEQFRHSIDSWEASTPRAERPSSTETIIVEDDGPQTEAAFLSGGSKDETLPLSCETGRPRSKGWWNLMLSPMLSRAGTNATKKAISPAEEAPPLPCLSATTEKGFGLGEETSITSAFSPETPRRAGLDNLRNSTWSNWAQWERDRDQTRAVGEALDVADEAEANALRDKESDPSVPVVIETAARRVGLAAEYYQACAFDLLNPVPYFECEKHDCAKSLPNLGDFSKGAVQPSNTETARDSGAVVATNKGVIESCSPPGDARSRSGSDSTIIEDDPVELSPNVRKADARPILKAASCQKIDPSADNDRNEKNNTQASNAAAEVAGASTFRAATPPPYSPPPAKPNIPRYVGIMPPSCQFVPSSPGPLSPQAQIAMNPAGGIPMSQIQPPAPTFINFSSTYPADLPPRPVAACVSLSDIENPVEVRKKAEVRRRRLEQEDAAAQKAGGLWRGRGCFPRNGCFGRGGSAGRTRRRWYIAIATGFVLMIILVVVLATQLTRRGDQTPVQSQWLNLTGYPPMPTGISTISQPDVASTVTACVQPSSLWSCALPREDQGRNAPNDSDQPNFRLEIRFRNGTVNANRTVPVSETSDKRAIASGGIALRRRQNDPFTNSLFEPDPAPPGLEDQTFLGNTTDNTTTPFNGEATPFYITFLTSDPSIPESFNDTNQSPTRRRRRQSGSGSGSIPAPALLPDGTAAPANLLPNNPLPHSQPVMLYNRGLESEHYGFYTYFDKSIFIKITDQLNSSSSSADSGNSGDPENSNGGSSKQDADLRCTWAQTRFLVQIWTNQNFGGQLLASTNGTGASSGPANDQQGGSPNPAKSSATDFSRPGSFPYPVTVTLDRHGGDASKKGVYCYGMDGQQKIVVSEKKLVAELRGAGGTLINGAPGIFSNPAGDGGFDPKAGGIDGGTGGCGCEWRNWAGTGG